MDGRESHEFLIYFSIFFDFGKKKERGQNEIAEVLYRAKIISWLILRCFHEGMYPY